MLLRKLDIDLETNVDIVNYAITLFSQKFFKWIDRFSHN